VKRAPYFLLLAVAAFTGCNNSPLPFGSKSFVQPADTAAAGNPATAPALRPPPVPPVSAGQINASNAYDKAQALRQELDREVAAEPDAMN